MNSCTSNATHQLARLLFRDWVWSNLRPGRNGSSGAGTAVHDDTTGGGYRACCIAAWVAQAQDRAGILMAAGVAAAVAAADAVASAEAGDAEAALAASLTSLDFLPDMPVGWG